MASASCCVCWQMHGDARSTLCLHVRVAFTDLLGQAHRHQNIPTGTVRVFTLLMLHGVFSPSPQQTTLIGSSISLWVTSHFMLKFCMLEI